MKGSLRQRSPGSWELTIDAGAVPAPRSSPNFADKTMTRYWVYENWTRDRARFHRADCSFCNDGRGVQPNASNRNGKWHKRPFGTRAEAESYAMATGRGDVGPCGHCAA